MDIVNGIESPLPDLWKVSLPNTSSEESAIIKVTKSNIDPHLSAFKFFNDPIDTDLNINGVLIYTR